MGNLPPLRLRESSAADFPLVLAPLEGLTTAAYRRVFFRRYAGLNGAIAPFIGTIRLLKRYSYHLRDILPEKNPSVPLIPQVLGADADGVYEVARACADLGYRQLNWNIGCPIPNIVRKRRGSGILPHPGMIEEVLNRMCRPGLPAFSVKLRLGLEDRDEWRRILPLLNQADIDFLVLHPRTGRQMYRGVPDREAFGEFLAECRHPLFWSGDMYRREDYLQLSSSFPGTAGWLLGRGILARPVLAEEIRSGKRIPFGLGEALGFLEELAGEFLAAGNERPWILGKMKLYFSYLRHGTDDAAEGEAFWQRLRRITEWERFEELLLTRQPGSA